MIELVQASIFNDTRVVTFGTNFAIEITFEVAISTSEVMQNHLSSLKIEFNALIAS